MELGAANGKKKGKVVKKGNDWKGGRKGNGPGKRGALLVATLINESIVDSKMNEKGILSEIH